MTRRHLVSASIAIAFVIAAALGRPPRLRADEDDEHPITSSAAQVTRDAAGHVLIRIRPATRREIGLRTEKLARVTERLRVKAYGFVTDPAPLAALNGSLSSARAALDAASAEYRRSSRLYHERNNASLRAMQSAQAVYLSDQARVQAIELRMRGAWGPEIAEMSPSARARLIDDLIARRIAIARVTVPTGAHLIATPHAAIVRLLGHERDPIPARAVFVAPAVNQAMQGQAFLIEIASAGFPLRPGTAVSAGLPASQRAEQGVIVPRSAVVRYAGARWVYCELDGDRFERRKIAVVQAGARGYFVTANLAPGSRVVVTGAQMLLSQELNAGIQMED